MKFQKELWMLKQNLIQPILALRRRYLPLLMIYFAYGCSTFSGIGETFFVKEKMNLSAEALMMIGVWLLIPWTIKMVFGQFVDSVPLLGSQRRGYIYLAAVFMALGSILMSGLAGNWHWVHLIGSTTTIFVTASLVTIIGVVLQDVVADAMSVEVVERKGRTDKQINKDLAMVQLLGRLSVSIGMFVVAGFGGWLAHVLTYEQLFLTTLIIPIIGVSGALLVKIDTPRRQPIKPAVLLGGLVFAAFVIFMGVSRIQYGQEIVFLASMAVVLILLYQVIKEVDSKTFKTIIAASIVIFVFRSMPGAGPGAQWFMIDSLGFDKSFFGVLAQIGSGLAIVGMWFLAKWVTEKPVSQILAILTIVSFVLSWPLIAMYYGFHDWTEHLFGFGARTIALVDTAISSPFAQLSMVPVLALVARHAPRGNAATWFALMASFMNLALSAGGMLSKYLNQHYVVTRQVVDAAGHITTPADYSQLGYLLIITAAVGFVLPLVTIWWFLGRK